MKRILLIGPLLSNSGYGIHSRQVFDYLLQRKDIQLSCYETDWGNTSWQLKSYDDSKSKTIENIIPLPVNVFFLLPKPDGFLS